jgi:hypothetical protein
MKEGELMEQILTALKEVQNTNLEILSRVANVEDRLIGVEDRLIGVEDNQVLMTDRLYNLELTTRQGFADLHTRLNTVVISNQLMNYSYDSIKENHQLHSNFLINFSNRLSKLEKKSRKNKNSDNQET